MRVMWRFPTVCSRLSSLHLQRRQTFLPHNSLSLPGAALSARYQSNLYKNEMAPSSSLQGHLLCAIPYPEPTAALERIRRKHPGLQVTFIKTKPPKPGATPDAVHKDLWKDITILCSLFDFPPDFGLSPDLQYVHLASAGSDHIQNSPLVQETQIPISTSSGIHGPILGEWVLMTMLLASHKYPILHEWQKDCIWDDSPSGKAHFASVADRVNKRIGILGYGSIGRQVARLAKALGMDVVAYTRTPRETTESRRDHGYVVPGIGDPNGEFPSKWFSGTDKQSVHEFLSYDLDHLVVSLPLTDFSRGLLGKEEFELLSRRNAFVTNIARGDVIVQRDLVDALHKFEQSCGNQGLRGAAVDVASPEPLPTDDALWKAPNITITPHMSGSNKDYATRVVEVLEANLDRMSRNERLLNIIDRKTGYACKTI